MEDTFLFSIYNTFKQSVGITDKSYFDTEEPDFPYKFEIHNGDKKYGEGNSNSKVQAKRRAVYEWLKDTFDPDFVEKVMDTCIEIRQVERDLKIEILHKK